MKAKKLLTISRKSKQEDKQEKNKKSEYRQEILKKIEQLEKEGKFDVDVEDDPNTRKYRLSKKKNDKQIKKSICERSRRKISRQSIKKQ